jgi:hypothetical protein
MKTTKIVLACLALIFFLASCHILGLEEQEKRQHTAEIWAVFEAEKGFDPAVNCRHPGSSDNDSVCLVVTQYCKYVILCKDSCKQDRVKCDSDTPVENLPNWADVRE